MTYQNVYDWLSLSGLPITYYQWQKGSAPAPPYLIYYYPNRDDFRADNENYAQYIESEGLYECLYTMEVVINAED